MKNLLFFLLFFIFFVRGAISDDLKAIIKTDNFYYSYFDSENEKDLLLLNTKEQVKILYDWMGKLRKNYGFTKFAIYKKDSKEFVGRGGFHVWDRKLTLKDIKSFSLNNLSNREINEKNFFEKIEGQPEFGMILRKEFRGKGLGSKIEFELVDWFFKQKEFEKYQFIVAGVDHDNIVSIKMLEKVFVRVAEVKKTADSPGSFIYICERDEFARKKYESK